MDMMMIMLLLLMLPNLLGGLSGMFGGTGQGNQTPNIYINAGSGGGGYPPSSDEDTSWNVTTNPDGTYTWKPSTTPADKDDNPYDLMIGGAVAGAGLGAWLAPATLGVSVLAGGLIGGAIGWMADNIFF
jgi:hypothetical protein